MCHKNIFWLFFLLILGIGHSQKIKEKSEPNDFNFFDNAKKNKGFFTFFLKESTNEVILEIDEFKKDFLYVNSLSTGIGNNDIGLDRGQLGQERIVFFEKIGNKIFLIQPNLKFRAVTENKFEKQSVKEAFAKSVLYGFDIEKVVKGKYYINLTSFLLQDAHGVSLRLKNIGEGNYKVDDSRSVINHKKTKSFPNNVEFDAMLTFKGDPKGSLIRSVTPTPQAVTVYQHHSFVKLPDENFKPRKFDPRSGAIPFKYFDYSSPVNEPLIKDFIIKHRLEKINPDMPFSDVINPIVYYVDLLPLMQKFRFGMKRFFPLVTPNPCKVRYYYYV